MFADLGHFSKKGIQVIYFHQHYTATLRSSPCELFMLWSVELCVFCFQIAFLSSIYPSLVLTYAGQTAYLINNVNDFSDGFYKFVPRPVYWPMFIIATLAAIVASQSLISATFSVIKQSVVLDYFPRVKVVHTSQHKEGEVYSPETNYILMVLCVSVVLGFGAGNAIGNAFGEWVLQNALHLAAALFLHAGELMHACMVVLWLQVLWSSWSCS